LVRSQCRGFLAGLIGRSKGAQHRCDPAFVPGTGLRSLNPALPILITAVPIIDEVVPATATPIAKP
jgi:hypothetical protein